MTRDKRAETKAIGAGPSLSCSSVRRALRPTTGDRPVGDIHPAWPPTSVGQREAQPGGGIAMTEFWTMGPTAAGLGLRAQGFSLRQAERLVRLKLRCERGEFRELTDQQKRLLFARWLVEHGRLNDGSSARREHYAERSTTCRQRWLGWRKGAVPSLAFCPRRQSFRRMIRPLPSPRRPTARTTSARPAARPPSSTARAVVAAPAGSASVEPPVAFSGGRRLPAGGWTRCPPAGTGR